MKARFAQAILCTSFVAVRSTLCKHGDGRGLDDSEQAAFSRFGP